MDETSQNGTTKKDTKPATKGKKRDRSASEKRLLKAAEDIFSKHGFNGSTTRMIAQKAKVNESLIGRYFDGKMGLLLGVISHYVNEEEDRNTLPYPPQENIIQEMLGFAQYRFDHDCKKNFDLFKIVLSQIFVDAKFSKKIRETLPVFHQPGLEARLQNLIDTGKVKKDLDIKKTVKELELFMIGNLITQRVILGSSDQETYDTLKSFITSHYKDA